MAWSATMAVLVIASATALSIPASSTSGCVTENVPGHSSLCWTTRTSATQPPNRFYPAMAADPATGRVVLFGGRDSLGNVQNRNYLNDTWTWDRMNWTQQHPATSPSRRFYANMSTDPASGHVLLFGGASPFGPLNDTWTWDGRDWTKRHPVTSPPARYYGNMATDPASHQVVFFGGVDSVSGTMSDTWTWDGSNWTQQHPATSPPSRADAGTAADPATGHVVIFGGTHSTNISGCCLGDTWTWDGMNWTEQHPTTSPSGRADAAVAPDPATGQVILFGGVGTGFVFLSDTWTWDGTTWTRQHLASPSARGAAGRATDPVGRVVVFGGADTPNGMVFADTWSITPSLTIRPNRGPPGTRTSVHGFGYTPGATVMVIKYRTSQHPPPAHGPYTVICSATVGSDTSFTCVGKVPTGLTAGAPGPHDVVGKDSAGLKSRTQFLLT